MIGASMTGALPAHRARRGSDRYGNLLTACSWRARGFEVVTSQKVETRGSARKEATRSRLLDALRDGLTGGGQAVRVADIVESAGVSHGTFYLHFGSIEEALGVVGLELLEDVTADLAQLHRPDGGLASARHLMERYVDALERVRPRWQALRMTASSPQDLDALSLRLHVRVAAMLAATMTGAAGPLEPDDDAALRVASLVVGMVERALSLWRGAATGEDVRVLASTPAAARAVLLTAVDALWARASEAAASAPSSSADGLVDHDAPPERDALVLGHRAVTYGDLRERVLRTAAWLDAQGLRAGDCLALLLHNGIAAIELGLAGRHLGLTVVPLNTYWGVEEVERALAHSRAAALAFDEETRSIVNSMHHEDSRALVRLPIGVVGEEERYERELARWSADDAPPPAGSSTTMWYTSGTTSEPKGVVRHESASERQRHLAFLSDLFGVGRDDTCLLAGPLHHAAHYLMANMALSRGATLVVMPRFDAECFLALVQERRVTRTMVVPTMLYRLLRLPDEVHDRYDVGSLESIIHTAAPCPSDLKRAAIERFGPILDEFYGATEMGGTYAQTSEWLDHPGTVGRPWSIETQVAIVGPDGTPLPADFVGQVALLDPRRAPFSYARDPERTAALTSDGLFLTGDLGWLDEDGYLYLAERESDVVISGGVNVYPSEIEAVLNAQEGVADAAVVGLPDPEWGERVTAFVEPLPGASVEPDRLRAAVRATLAHYKCPREWHLVDHLPRDAAGKLRRRDLRPVVETA